jgi:hypothetical protein
MQLDTSELLTIAFIGIVFLVMVFRVAACWEGAGA